MNVSHGPARPGLAACGCLLALVSWCASAATPRLVRDINPTPQPISSTPTDFTNLGATSFFTANDGVRGYEPWTTDGTEAGTFTWGDLAEGISGTIGRVPLRAGGLTYLVQNESFAPPSLWVSDGTPQGTRRVDVTAWATNALNVYALGALGELMALGVFNGATGARELWLSDGADAGTRRVPAANGEIYSLTTHLIVGSRLYFLSLNDGVFEPWVSDGTEQGTYRLAEIPNAAPGSTRELVQAGDFIFFTASTTTDGLELWRIDTRDSSVQQVTNIAPGSASGLTENSRMGRAGSVVVFPASAAGDSDMDLWRSDGTPAGTYQISDLDVLSSWPIYRPAGNRLLFLTAVPNGVQLWATDGSAQGTELILNSGSFNNQMFPVGDRLYFGDPSEPTRVWSTDGTPAGTLALNGLIPAQEQLLDIAGASGVIYVRTVGQRLPPPNNHLSGPGHVYRYDLASASRTTLTRYELENAASIHHFLSYAQGRLYFDNIRPETGRELWISDGTANGTRMLKNLAPETRTFDSSPSQLVRLRDRVFFTADDGAHGREVWYSDGTNEGTQMLLDAAPGEMSAEPTDLFVSGAHLYFFARDAANTYRLWRSDGSAAGSAPLAAIEPRHESIRYAGCDSRGVTLSNGMIVFSGYQEGSGIQLWRTDGSPTGTVRLTQLTHSYAAARLCQLTAVGNQAYFDVYDDGGRELWKTDGTATGTQLVADLNAERAGSEPRSLTPWNGRLYFIANNEQGPHLWTTDGNAPSTRIAATFAGGEPVAIAGVLDGKLLVSVRNASMFTHPWVLSGSTETLLAPQTLVTLDGVPFVNNGRAFFSAHSTLPTGSDIEPWVTDGTLAGTAQLLNTNPGFSYPSSFTDFHGITIFETRTFQNTRRLWRTNGVAAGTRMLGEFTLGAERVAANQHLFYIAADSAAGIELFAIDNERPIAADDTLGTVQAGQSISMNVLANDRDNDGELNPGDIAILTAPAGGSVRIGASGEITYTARGNFAGADSFTYSVADEQGYQSEFATVRVTVTASTTPPPPPPGGGGGGGGGGGSMPLSDLALLALLAALSRQFSHRARSRAR